MNMDTLDFGSLFIWRKGTLWVQTWMDEKCYFVHDDKDMTQSQVQFSKFLARFGGCAGNVWGPQLVAPISVGLIFNVHALLLHRSIS